MPIPGIFLSRFRLVKISTATAAIIVLGALAVSVPAFADNAPSSSASPAPPPTPSPSAGTSPRPAVTTIPSPGATLTGSPIGTSDSVPTTAATAAAAPKRTIGSASSSDTTVGTGVLAGHVYLGSGATTAASANSVTVKLYAIGYSAGSAPIATEQVDALGEYRFSGLSTRYYYLRFDYTGSVGYFSTWYAQDPADFLPEEEVDADQSTAYIFDQSLFDSPATISGAVSLPGGSPVGAGDVTVSYAPEITHQTDVAIQVIGAFSAVTSSTDSNGDYALTGLPPGDYVLKYNYNGSGDYQTFYNGPAGTASCSTPQ